MCYTGRPTSIFGVCSEFILESVDQHGVTEFAGPGI